MRRPAFWPWLWVATASPIPRRGSPLISKAASNRLGGVAGSAYTASHKTPSKAGDCAGPYTVQFDRVGALIVWCRDAAGATVSSHSTTYHARFVDTQRTFILDKPPGSALAIDLERRNGRAVIVDVR